MCQEGRRGRSGGREAGGEGAGGWTGGVGDGGRGEGAEVVRTSDHGNAGGMRDDTTGQAHTAHTLNLVPCVYVGRPATLMPGGALQDIAPTLLALMGLQKPPEMTGHSLVRF